MSDQWQPDPRQQQSQYLPPWQPQQGYQPPPQQPRQQPPRPRSRRGLACLGCGGLGAVVVLIAALAASHSSSSAPPAALPTIPTVALSQAAAPADTTAAAQTLTYYVSGSPADVTYGPTGTNVSGTVPLSVSGPLGSPLYYHITAQLQGSGAVTCKLEIDGKVISQATASGGYNIAMCEISRDPLTGAWQDTNG